MQKKVFGATLGASVSLVRALRPVLPSLLGNPAGRTALLAQLSARPWAVPAAFALSEVRGLADAPRSSPAIKALASNPDQQGAPADTLPGPVLVVWGKQDRVTPASQATRAQRLFPDARLELSTPAGTSRTGTSGRAPCAPSSPPPPPSAPAALPGLPAR